MLTIKIISNLIYLYSKKNNYKSILFKIKYNNHNKKCYKESNKLNKNKSAESCSQYSDLRVY